MSRIDTLAAGPGRQSVFVWSGANVEAVLDGQGKLVQRFLHGPGVDQVLAVETFGQAAAPGSQGNLQWTLTDHIGTIRGLISADGNTVVRLRYDAYGRPLDSGLVPLFGFAGREWDAGVGLYSNRARWYDPITGRFVSQDPIGIAGGLNRYAYALGNPTVHTDPTGQIPPLVVAIGASVLIHAVAIGTAVMVEADYHGYRARGWGVGEAFWFSMLANLPLTGSGVAIVEMVRGKSLHGHDYDKPLSGWGYGFRGLQIGLDAISVGMIARSLGAARMLGRGVSSGPGRGVGGITAEVTGRAKHQIPAGAEVKEIVYNGSTVKYVHDPRLVESTAYVDGHGLLHLNPGIATEAEIIHALHHEIVHIYLRGRLGIRVLV